MPERRASVRQSINWGPCTPGTQGSNGSDTDLKFALHARFRRGQIQLHAQIAVRESSAATIRWGRARNGSPSLSSSATGDPGRQFQLSSRTRAAVQPRRQPTRPIPRWRFPGGTRPRIRSGAGTARPQIAAARPPPAAAPWTAASRSCRNTWMTPSCSKLLEPLPELLVLARVCGLRR